MKKSSGSNIAKEELPLIEEESEEEQHDTNEKSQFMASHHHDNDSEVAACNSWETAVCSSYDWAPCIPARYILVVMGFIGLSLDYALRINLSIAIIGMKVSMLCKCVHDQCITIGCPLFL